MFNNIICDYKINKCYLELDYLGDALKEYADRPSDVMAWLERLLNAELAD